MKFSCEDLNDLERIWPIGEKLIAPSGGNIVVAGSFKGRYMHYLVERFPSAGLIIGFEPQGWACDEARNRLASAVPDGKWRICNYALGTTDGISTFKKFKTDGCGGIGASDDKTNAVEVRDAARSLSDEVFGEISILVLNMEGSEHELVPFLFEECEQPIASIAIQLHGTEDQCLKTHALIGTRYKLVCEDFPTWCYWRIL